MAYETNSGYAEIKEIIRNPRTRTTKLIATNSTSYQYPWGISSSSDSLIYILSDDKPAEQVVESTYNVSVEQGDRVLKLKGQLTLTSDVKNYYYKYKRTVMENGKILKEKEWVETIPRAW